jgi:hypothetical protein
MAVGVASTVGLEVADSTAEVEDFAEAASAAEGSADISEDSGVIAVDTARMDDPEDSLALMGGATDTARDDLSRTARTGEDSGRRRTRDLAHRGREAMLESPMVDGVVSGKRLVRVARKDADLARGRALEPEVEHWRRRAGIRLQARPAYAEVLWLRAGSLRGRARSEPLRPEG